MNQNTNSLNWFEIPAPDMERARNFYQTIFNIEMGPVMDMMGMSMSGFPYDQGSGKASGALVTSDLHVPSMNGCNIYLNADPNIQEVLDRIEPAGGKIIMPRTDIGNGVGFMAVFTDTEGNKMCLHAQN